MEELVRVADFRDNGHVGGISTGLLRQYAHLKSFLEIDFFYLGSSKDYIGKLAMERGLKVNNIDTINGFSINTLFKILCILKGHKYDVIIVRGYRAAMYIFLASLFIRKSHIIKILHGRPVTDTPRRRVKRMIDDYLNRRIDTLAAVSRIVCNELAVEFGKDVYYLPNCYSFSPSDNMNRQWDVTFIGRLEEAKGFDFFLKVLDEIDTEILNILVIGKGAMGSVTCGCHSITYIEHSDKVEEYLSESKVFFFPSRFEGLPNVILEALGAGAHCFATDVGGISEILDWTDYDFIDFADVESVKNTLLDLIHSYPNFEMIRKGWNKIEESYGSDTFISSYQTMLYEVLRS